MKNWLLAIGVWIVFIILFWLGLMNVTEWHNTLINILVGSIYGSLSYLICFLAFVRK